MKNRRENRRKLENQFRKNQHPNDSNFRQKEDRKGNHQMRQTKISHNARMGISRLHGNIIY